MRRPVGVLVALVLLVSAPLAACSDDEPPAADATGPVEATDVQASPQSLVLELIRLREEGHPEDAARYFINYDIFCSSSSKINAWRTVLVIGSGLTGLMGAPSIIYLV